MKRSLLVASCLLFLAACDGSAILPVEKEAMNNQEEEIEELSQELERVKKQIAEMEQADQESQFDDIPEHAEDLEPNHKFSDKTLMKAPETDNQAATEVLPEQRLDVDTGFTKYNGRFFDVQYPDSFTLINEETFSEPDPEVHPGADGITVQSSDGAVQFYVYSPLCSGVPEWRELKESEAAEDVTIEEAEHHLISRGAINGPGYSRFFEERKGKYDMPCLMVFGLQYSSAEAYEPYRQAYTDFKNSLVQYWWD